MCGGRDNSPEYSACVLIGWQSCQTADWLITPWYGYTDAVRSEFGSEGHEGGWRASDKAPDAQVPCILGPPRCILGLAPVHSGEGGQGRGSGCLSLVSLHGKEWVLRRRQHVCDSQNELQKCETVIKPTEIRSRLILKGQHVLKRVKNDPSAAHVYCKL